MTAAITTEAERRELEQREEAKRAMLAAGLSEDQAEAQLNAATTVLRSKGADKYKPFLEAYRPNPENDLGAKFVQDMEKGGRIEGSILLRESRYPLRLSESESKRFAEQKTVLERAAFFREIVDRKVRESADRIVGRLRERGLDGLHPVDEQFLREVGLLVDNPDYTVWLLRENAIDEAALAADPNPSKAQKEVGNYRKGHVRVHGLEISIENPKGSERKGVDGSGKAWKTTLPAHYGYIRRTTGADDEHVDCYIGPDPESEQVWIVHQVHHETKAYDEDKVMLGFKTEAAALAAYKKAFSDGKGGDRIGAVTPLTIAGFKEWLGENAPYRESDRTAPPQYLLREAVPPTANPYGWPALYGDDTPNLGSASSYFMDGAYLPYGAGPFGQQMYLQSQWDMLAKCFALSAHHPMAISALTTLVEFVVGTGVKVKAKDEALDGFLREFWTRECMDIRLAQWVWSWFRDGEIFVRPIPLLDGTGRSKVRTADPTTIWEIVTAAEDIEDVQYYRQQYQTRTQLYTPNNGVGSLYIMRDFRPEEVIHRKINVGPEEVRGRSDFATVLGWAALLNDYFETVVGKERASAAVGLDVKVKGGPADVQAVQANFVLPSTDNAGSANFHTDNVEVTDVAYKPAQTTGAGTTWEGIVTMFANGVRVPRAYLNAGGDDMTRAGTLTATAPFAKHALFRQMLVRELLQAVLRPVIRHAQQSGVLDAVQEWVVDIEFPEIVTADIDKFIELLEQGEAMDYLSHETAGGLYAIKLGIKNYDFKKEQDAIKADRTAGEGDDGAWKGTWKNYQSVPRKPTCAAKPGGAAGDGDPETNMQDDSKNPLAKSGQQEIRRSAESLRESITVRIVG